MMAVIGKRIQNRKDCLPRSQRRFFEVFTGDEQEEQPQRDVEQNSTTSGRGLVVILESRFRFPASVVVALDEAVGVTVLEKPSKS